MMGYCKFCGSHDLWVSRLDKSPDGEIIRNDKNEPMGMCWHCEVANKVSKEDLIDTVNDISDSIHYHVYLKEKFSAYPDGSMHNAEDLKKQFGHLNSEMNILCEIIVAGAMRRKEENTPEGKKYASKSARTTVIKVIKNPFGGSNIDELTAKKFREKGCGRWIE